MTVQINLLSNDEIGLALDKVLTFLSERGVRIQHKRLLKTLGQAGARVGSETQIEDEQSRVFGFLDALEGESPIPYEGFFTASRKGDVSMAKRLKLKVGEETATMVLLEDEAPRTCKSFLECLPIKSQVIHAKFAGPEFMVKVPFFSDMENPAIHQDPGNVCLNDPSQTMCVFYDAVPGMGPCTLFAKIIGNLEGIQKEGRKAWKKGGAPVEIYE